MRPPIITIRAQRLRLALLGIAVALSITLLASGMKTEAVWFSGSCWLVYLLGTLRPSCAWFGPVFSSMPPDAAAVVLTIDDGPDPATTPALLALLREHQAPAVFFLIGERAQKHPELVKAIVKDGHQIGNHSLTHPSGRFWMLGPNTMWREIAGCQGVLEAITGSAPLWYRSPVGHSNPFVQPVLNALGLKRIAWSARGFDAVKLDIEQVIQILRPDIKPGSIILLHEATTIAIPLLKRVLEELAAKGLKTRPLVSASSGKV